MMRQAKTNLIVELAVLTEIAAVVGANDFQASRPKNRATYLGISDEHLTGSPSISRDGLVAAYDMETLTRDEKLKDFSGNNNLWNHSSDNSSERHVRKGTTVLYSK
jgi:hypothetical protein